MNKNSLVTEGQTKFNFVLLQIYFSYIICKGYNYER